MEARFGTNFSNVRIHNGERAADAADVLAAKAYTVGNDIVFGKGMFAPEQSSGKHLLAHELAHVVQQRRGGTAPPLAGSPALEGSAERAASAAVNGAGPVDVGGASAPGIARMPNPYRLNRDVWWEITEELGLAGPGATKVKPGAAEAARDANTAGLMKGIEPGTADIAVQSHNTKSRVRNLLGLSGKDVESAHIGPTAALRELKNYSRGRALTSLLKKEFHGAIDVRWERAAKRLVRMREAKGLTGDALNKVSAASLRNSVSRAIRLSVSKADFDKLSEAEQIAVRRKQGALQWKLFDEMHGHLGLKPNDLVRLPYSKLGALKSGAKKGVGPGLAALGAAMQYHGLRESGHGQAESIAGASGHRGVAGGLGLAMRSGNPLLKAQAGKMSGGGIGTVVTLGNAALQMMGVSKKVTDVTQTASDAVPMNMTGEALSVVARAGTNIVKGDWKAFDRQMKEVSEGKAGMPLEGYFRSVGLGVDTFSEAAQKLSDTKREKGSVGAGDVLRSVGESAEHNILKQKFSSATENVWGVTGGPVLLREIKFAESLARGKSWKQAAADSREMEKNALINRALDHATDETKAFVKRDLPEALDFAKKDVERAKEWAGEKAEQAKDSTKSFLRDKATSARKWLGL
jgi:hypothetical protein